MNLKKAKTTQKIFVAQIKTELVIAASSPEEALDIVNKHIEDSIEKYTESDLKTKDGWGFHLNELNEISQLQDQDNANVIPYNHKEKLKVKDIIKN